ncbi:hypothetical protein MUK42_04097 [Musa troglodytarum]|uniref:Uncharacterized protein n=1 Tax=Musa troglodytarum TaxID=320322 RepID=A0A9E7GBY6_9LILI|nr:hypothetical protein MUK42_04097 [Musa troglodytarum]
MATELGARRFRHVSVKLPMMLALETLPAHHYIWHRRAGRGVIIISSSILRDPSASMEAAAGDQLWDDEGLDVLTELDSALLMELLDEQRGEDGDDDNKLGLAAEISATGPVMGSSSEGMLLESVCHQVEYEDCRLEDVLSGLGSHGFWAATESAAVEAPCSDMVDWYVDEYIDEQVGMAGYGEARDHSTLYYSGDTSVEQYTSLWE